MKKPVQTVASQIAAILQDEGIETYDQTKNLFSEIRKAMQIAPPKERANLRAAKVISTEEVKHFLHIATQTDPTTGLIMETLYRLAVRAQELASLQVTNFHPEKHYLLVATKNGEHRQLPITTSLSKQLKDHLGSRTNGPLFTSNRGQAFSTRRIQQLVSDLADQTSLQKKITPATLRNSRIAHLRNAGMSEEDLLDFTG
jgi:site-specific recombinase XerD